MAKTTVSEDEFKTRQVISYVDGEIVIKTLEDGRRVGKINSVAFNPDAYETMLKKLFTLTEQSIALSSVPISNTNVVKYVRSALGRLSLSKDEKLVARVLRRHDTVIFDALAKLESNERIKSEHVAEIGYGYVQGIRMYSLVTS